MNVVVKALLLSRSELVGEGEVARLCPRESQQADQQKNPHGRHLYCTMVGTKPLILRLRIPLVGVVKFNQSVGYRKWAWINFNLARLGYGCVLSQRLKVEKET